MKKTSHLHHEPTDIMLSFDVVYMFTQIPLMETLDLITNLVDPETINVIRNFLSSTLFSLLGTFYEYINETTMGSSLSPLVTKIFMEHLEVKAIKS